MLLFLPLGNEIASLGPLYFGIRNLLFGFYRHQKFALSLRQGSGLGLACAAGAVKTMRAHGDELKCWSCRVCEAWHRPLGARAGALVWIHDAPGGLFPSCCHSEVLEMLGGRPKECLGRGFLVSFSPLLPESHEVTSFA